MLRDAEYFRTKIGFLDEGNNAGDFLVQLVKSKFVPKPVATTQQVSKDQDNNEGKANAVNDQTSQTEEQKEIPNTSKEQ